jgi:hypothetical protein
MTASIKDFKDGASKGEKYTAFHFICSCFFVLNCQLPTFSYNSVSSFVIDMDTRLLFLIIILLDQNGKLPVQFESMQFFSDPSCL